MVPRFAAAAHLELKSLFALFVKTAETPLRMKESEFKSLVDAMQTVRGLEPLNMPQIDMLYGYMDVLNRGSVSFFDFLSGLAHACDDYTFRIVLQLRSQAALVDCSRTVREKAVELEKKGRNFSSYSSHNCLGKSKLPSHPEAKLK